MEDQVGELVEESDLLRLARMRTFRRMTNLFTVRNRCNWHDIFEHKKLDSTREFRVHNRGKVEVDSGPILKVWNSRKGPSGKEDCLQDWVPKNPVVVVVVDPWPIFTFKTLEWVQFEILTPSC